MIDYSNYEKVFGSLGPFPYHRTYILEVESYRRSFEGALFIDRVLLLIVGHLLCQLKLVAQYRLRARYEDLALPKREGRKREQDKPCRTHDDRELRH